MERRPAAKGAGSHHRNVKFGFHSQCFGCLDLEYGVNTKLRIRGDGKRGKMRAEIPVSYTPSAMNPRPNLCSDILTAVRAPLYRCSSAPPFSRKRQHWAVPRGNRALTPCLTPKRSIEVAVSPDGSRVAYIVEGKLTVIPAGGGPSKTIAVEGNLVLRDVVWSSDSKHLAFIAELPGDVPAAQLWTAAADGSSPAKHAELKGYVQAPRFSPDGSRLAMLFIEAMPRAAGPLQPMTPLAGVIDEKIFEERIATIDLGTDHLTQVTPADMYVYEYDWTPDGQGLGGNCRAWQW